MKRKAEIECTSTMKDTDVDVVVEELVLRNVGGGDSILHPRHGMLTRSQKKLRAMVFRKEKQSKKKDEKREDQILLEGALGIVISNGFLYQHDCMSLACTNQGCYDLWQELLATSSFPSATADVEIRYCPCCHRDMDWEDFNEFRWFLDENPRFEYCDPLPAGFMVTEQLVTSKTFLKNVFEKLQDLYIRSRPAKKQRAEALANVQKWGTDVHVVDIITWNANSFNCGGIHLSFEQSSSRKGRTGTKQPRRQRYRLRTDLSLWTGLTPRAQRLYDGLPLLSLEDDERTNKID